jgi:hypothetical protein
MGDCKFCHGSFYDDLKLGFLRPFRPVCGTDFESVEIVKMTDDNTFRLRVYGEFEDFSEPLKGCPICGRKFLGDGLNPWH